MTPPNPDLLSTDEAAYRLVRLILIDSYSPGRVVEFPVDGGAVLTGRNGRGKTTLLQLVPIFYGENPARIVGTETNRLDFNGYYLPRLTSYIVFEYLRRGVPCLSVDRLGRSLQQLVALLSDLQAKGVDLHIHQQGIDTTTPAGTAMFQMCGVFAQFERAMIQERVKAGLVLGAGAGSRQAAWPAAHT